jgi:uncharacterized protein (DUF2141 family)
MLLTGALLTLALLASQDAAVAGTGIIRVSLTSPGAGEGQVIALLFDEEAGSMTDPSLAVAGSYADVDGDVTEISFLGIPWGEYAVIVFQDTDGDGEPDCDPGEDSSEPFGVSGMEPPEPPSGAGTDSDAANRTPPDDAEGSPPEGGTTISFENCCFAHSSDETLVEIVMMPSPGGPPRGGPGGHGGMPGGGPGGGGPGR